MHKIDDEQSGPHYVTLILDGFTQIAHIWMSLVLYKYNKSSITKSKIMMLGILDIPLSKDSAVDMKNLAC